MTALKPKERQILPLAVLLATIIGFVFADFGFGQTASLTDFQKESIESIREITLQLILIAMGVFALVGGFVSTSTRNLSCKFLLWLAFILLAVSVAAGLLAYGNLIWSLGKGVFEPFGSIGELAKWQWISFGAGGISFALFVLCNIAQKKG